MHTYIYIYMYIYNIYITMYAHIYAYTSQLRRGRANLLCISRRESTFHTPSLINALGAHPG